MSKILRASQTPLLDACQAALHHVLNGETVAESSGDPALLGTAVHKGCDMMRRGIKPDIAALAAEFRQIDFLIGWLIRRSWNLAQQILPFGENWRGEELLSCEIAGFQMSGHPDLFCVKGRRGFIEDYKTGRQKDYSSQLKAYAWLLLCENPDIEDFHLGLLYPRENEIVAQIVSADEVRLWADNFAAKIEQAALGEFWHVMGAHCEYCPARGHCVAVGQAIGGQLVPAGDDELFSAARIARTWQILPAVRAWVKDAEKALNVLVSAKGVVDLGDVALVAEQCEKKTLDMNVARSWLLENLSRDEIETAFSMSQTDVINIYKARARATGAPIGEAATRAKTELESVGLMKTTRYIKIKELKQ